MLNKTLPTGIRDEFGTLAMAKEKVLEIIQTNFRAQGFQKIITPLLEYRSVFKPLAKQAYQPYQFIDEHGNTLVLRPDMTLPVARVMSTTGIEAPVKWYYSGDIFRVNRRLSGQYNQVTQAGIEIIGYPSLKAEWECLSLASRICQQLALPDVTIELSDANFVTQVLQALPINPLMQATLKQALFAKQLTRYNQLIQPLATSEFYDFLKVWPWLFGDFDRVMAQLKPLSAITDLTAKITDLQKTKAFLQQQYPELTVTLDLSVASPQTYYTGMAFKAYSRVANDYLFSGGRYDQLLTSFQKTPQPAVGLAFDVDSILAQQNMAPKTTQTLIYFDPDQWQMAQDLLAELPNASLCLTDSLQAAQRLATKQKAQLIDLTERT